MCIKKIYILFTFLYILLFTACGGGGGSGPQTNIDQPTIQSASFIDAPVYGIDYSCSGSSTTGTTNENGTFDYDDSCGIITFKIGGVTLYSKDTSLIPSDKRLYITDLVGVDRTDTNNSLVLNLSRFIQSLDDNGNPYDGITINPDVKVTLESSTIDFSTNPSITDLNNTIESLGRTLVSEDDAKAHFTYTLNNDLSLEIEGPPPPAPILTVTPIMTNQNSVTVEVNGQPQTTIFLNGITTNTTIPVTSKIEITLPLIGADGNYDFNISLQDAAHQISNPKLFTINKDTISPIISTSSDINVSENNTVMVDVDASDATVTPYQALKYSIIGGIDKNYFTINSSTGVISYLSSIDYENPTDADKNNIYELQIEVTDGINTVSKSLQINIANIAEIAPSLTAFTGSVLENASNNSIVGAINFNGGDTAITNFELNNSDGTPQTIFNISHTGVITVSDNSTIDFDNGIKQYSLIAQATNSKGVSNLVPVIINVVNVSDIVAILANLTTSVNENSQAGLIVDYIPIQSSGDSAISSIVLTDLNTTNVSESFISSTTGSITVKSGATLDYETKPIYYLKAVATNSSGVSSDANVTISLNNIPETKPILETLTINIDENVTSGTHIGNINIVNLAQLDSNVTYFTLIGSGSGNFEINSSGSITVASGASIDYEKITSYSISVNAANLAGTSNAVNLNININNITDTKPILKSFSGTILENTPASSLVGVITILDSGDSPITSFSLLNENNTTINEFQVQSDGTILVKTGAILDFETNATYNLKAKATNLSGDSDFVSVNIYLQDVAETKPIIETFTGYIDENATVGTFIGNIDINTTGDSPINSFTLIGTGAGNFDINTTGHITLKAGALINYETTQFYQLEAYATNNAGDSAKVNVIIHINNISEIAPTLASTTLYVDENATVGTIIGQVNVISSGDSNTTAFTLSGTGTNNFNISSSGVISVASDASFSYPNSFTLETNATNLAGWSNTTTVTINTRDIPTILPVLHSLVLDVKEGTPKDMVVGQITIDAGDTAITNIEFTSALTTHDDAFTISTDGKIRVSGDVNLDFETRPQYQFNVKAINALGESNQVTITINILYVENLYIVSAVYDNNNTTLDGSGVPIVDDDTLYLYFSKTIDTATFSANRSDDFNISNGPGTIGSGSTTTYSDNPYHLYTIKGSYATGSLAFAAGSTKIAIANQELTDDNGSFPTNYIATTIEAFKHIMKTGQTTSYDNNGSINSSIKDDAYYNRGKERSFIRDNAYNIVIDNALNMIWEDTTNTTSSVGSWDSANSYCQGLTIGSYTNWRLPTIQEWLSIVDRSKYEPVIDSTYFQNNQDDGAYWSKTMDITNSSNYWLLSIKIGSIHSIAKSSDTRFVRCIHDR